MQWMKLIFNKHNLVEGIFQKGLENCAKFVLKRRDARFRFMWKCITCITTDITIVRILFSLSLQLMLGQSNLKVVKKLVLKKLKNEKKKWYWKIEPALAALREVL